MHMHGQLKQKKRNNIYDEFAKTEEGILISTDVLARGVDFPDVNWIIQFDPPQVSKHIEAKLIYINKGS